MMPDTQPITPTGTLADSYALTSAHGGTPESRDRVANENRLKIAPLVQASQAAQTRLALFADPNDPSKPVAGKEAEYAAAHDELADVIGKMRTTLHPPPANDPHGLGYLADKVSDKLHITRDLVDKAKAKQAVKVGNYQQQGKQDVKTAVQSTPYNPLSTDEQKQAARVGAGLDPRATTAGASGKPDVQSLTLKDGRVISAQWSPTGKKWQDLNGQDIPTDQLGGAVITPKPVAVKPVNRDDRYISILQKEQQKQPLSPDETAYLGAYNLWNKTTKIDPGIARAAAFGADRFVPVIDPNDPESVTFMRAGDAAREHAGSPAGIGFQTDKAVTKYFTSGAGAQNITNFNTASDHLKLLQQAGDALQNGDVQKFNSLANSFAAATGSPAPSNFEAVKAAVSGELAKTFKGAGATDQEIGQINTTINQAQSPEQIQGAIGYYTKLMDSKLQALQGQYQSGKSGKPNFVGPKTQQLRDSISSGSSKGIVSISQAMQKPKYKDKTKEQVSAAITAAGYTPVD